MVEPHGGSSVSVNGSQGFRLPDRRQATIPRYLMFWVGAIAMALIFIVCSAVSPDRALATVYGDQTLGTDEAIAAAIADGTIPAFGEVDAAQVSAQQQAEETARIQALSPWMLEQDTMPSLSAESTKDYAIKAFSGSNRYDTARIEAEYAFTSSEYAIIVSGENYPDALSASSLAGALACPILYTASTTLPDATIEVLHNLGVSKVVVIGGSSSISDDVMAQISTAIGDTTGGNVTRIAGDSRYTTQLAVFNYGSANSFWTSGIVLVATGTNFPDALSLATVAYVEKAPIFLVGSDGNLPDGQATALAKDTTMTKAVIAGGENSVSVQTVGLLDMVTMAGGGVRDVTRLSGENRYETSLAVAQWSVDSGILSWNGAAFASASSPYDALTACAVQAHDGGVFLLADEGATANISALASHGVSGFKFIGGSARYTNAFRTSWALTMGFKLSDIQGFVLFLDAGHGQNDSGNGYYDPGAGGCGYAEHDLNVEVVTNTAQILRGTYGMDVYENVDGGEYWLRQAKAYNLNCGAIVCIHFNAGGGSGTESYIRPLDDERYPVGSDILQNKVSTSSIAAAMGIADRGQQQEDFAILAGHVPSVLEEICFIDTWSDMDAYEANKYTVASVLAADIVS